MTSVLIFAAACASSPKTQNGPGCESPVGFIPEGQSATGYLHPLTDQHMPCEPGSLVCKDGAWSGAYIYPTCIRRS